MTDRTIEAVVFDYGGVLTVPIRTSAGQWLTSDQIEPDSFFGTMREWLGRDAAPGSPIHLLETGELTEAEFETTFAARLRHLDGGPVAAAGLLGRLFAGMELDPAMPELLLELRAQGLKVGVLSNSWANTYPPQLTEWCDASVISGEVGLRKPDPRIYELMLERLGVAAEHCAFVDDAPVNVAAATELGMTALRHHGAAETRAALRDLIPGLAEVHS